MIILEGADHTGKTTFSRLLTKHIAAKFGHDELSSVLYYGHMSRPPEDFDHVAEYMAGVGARCQDRYHLGSIVYGKILGGGSFVSARKMRVVQQYLAWRGCVTVVMFCERDKLRKRLMSAVDREEMYSMERILDANEAYRGLTKSSNDGAPYADVAIDVTDRWPDDATAARLVDDWWRRFSL